MAATTKIEVEGTEYRLTERQAEALIRVLTRDAPIRPELAKQLTAKGLLSEVHKYHRKEWNRTVATLSVCALYPRGIEVAERLAAAKACSLW